MPQYLGQNLCFASSLLQLLHRLALFQGVLPADEMTEIQVEKFVNSLGFEYDAEKGEDSYLFYGKVVEHVSRVDRECLDQVCLVKNADFIPLLVVEQVDKAYFEELVEKFIDIGFKLPAFLFLVFDTPRQEVVPSFEVAGTQFRLVAVNWFGSVSCGETECHYYNRFYTNCEAQPSPMDGLVEGEIPRIMVYERN